MKQSRKPVGGPPYTTALPPAPGYTFSEDLLRQQVRAAVEQREAIVRDELIKLGWTPPQQD